MTWSTRSLAGHAQLQHRATPEPERCKATCQVNDKEVWARPGCLGLDTDFRFVADDCGQAVVLFEYPEVAVRLEDSAVGLVLGPRGEARPLRLSQLVQRPSKLRPGPRRVRWLAGVLDEPGSQPHATAEGTGIRLEALDGTVKSRTFLEFVALANELPDIRPMQTTSPTGGGLYSWTDRQGTAHVVSSLGEVPEEYRRAAAAVADTQAVPGAAVEARYVMLVGGLPSGVVDIRAADGTYTYRSLQLYRSTQRARQVVLSLRPDGTTDDARVPEVLWLSRRPEPGCVAAVEELTGKSEQVCVDADRRHGRIGAVAFEAEYDASGQLSSLSLPGARFVASAEQVELGGDPFAEGFPVEGENGALRLQPPQAGVQVLPPGTRGVATAAELAQGNCLDIARARAKRARGLEVVLGVVVEEGRAWPHAWVREVKSGRSIDPSVSPGDAALKGRTWVQFPTAEAGRLYLELLAGQRRFARASPGKDP